MFITNNHDSFHLWWKENLVKHQKVSKCYDQDCSSSPLFSNCANWVVSRNVKIIFYVEKVKVQSGFFQRFEKVKSFYLKWVAGVPATKLMKIVIWQKESKCDGNLNILEITVAHMVPCNLWCFGEWFRRFREIWHISQITIRGFRAIKYKVNFIINHSKNVI